MDNCANFPVRVPSGRMKKELPLDLINLVFYMIKFYWTLGDCVYILLIYIILIFFLHTIKKQWKLSSSRMPPWKISVDDGSRSKGLMPKIPWDISAAANIAGIGSTTENMW